jgi:hypothetical protein
MASTVTILLGLFAAGVVPIREGAGVAPGSPPEFATVGQLDQKKGEITLLQRNTVVVPVAVRVNRNGIEQTETVYRQEIRIIERKYLVDGAAVYDPAGKKVETRKVWDQLGQGDTVLISSDGLPVDRRYLRVLRPNTLIFVVPAAPGGIPMPLPPSKR